VLKRNVKLKPTNRLFLTITPGFVYGLRRRCSCGERAEPLAVLRQPFVKRFALSYQNAVCL